MNRDEAIEIYRRARDEYKSISPCARADEDFAASVSGSANRLADERLRSRYRFFTGAARARAAKVAGKDYPEESLPTLAEWARAAQETVENLHYMIEEGILDDLAALD